MTKIYIIEEKILQCWSVVDEIKDIISEMESGNMDQNYALSLLNDVSGLYAFKFQKLYECYSDYLDEQYKKSKESVVDDKEDDKKNEKGSLF